MTSHSSSGLGTYLVAHRRFRPKPPADGNFLKYKKKEKKNPHHLSPAERLGTSVRIHPVARTDLEPPAAKGGGGAKKYHSLLAGHAVLVANVI